MYKLSILKISLPLKRKKKYIALYLQIITEKPKRPK